MMLVSRALNKLKSKSLSYAFESKSEVLAEQRNKPYMSYGEVSRASKNADVAPQVLPGKWLGQLAGKGGE